MTDFKIIYEHQQLFQDPKTVPYCKPRWFHNGRACKLSGWTDTKVGYLNEAESKVASLIHNNRKSPASYFFITINHTEDLTVNDIRRVWNLTTTRFRKAGLIGFWVVEPCREGGVHWHLLVKSGRYTHEDMKDKIKTCLSFEGKVSIVQKVIRTQMSLEQVCRYIIKAKDINGNDRWRHKRLLFRKGLRLQKCGHWGDFWVLPEKTLCQQRQAYEARVADMELNVDVQIAAEVAEQATGLPLRYLLREVAKVWVQIEAKRQGVAIQ